MFVNYFPNPDPEKDRVEASFYWEDEPTEDGFDIPFSEDLSLHMSGAFLSRVLAIRLYRKGMYENMYALEQMVGPDLANYMINAKSLGLIALNTDITPENRHFLSELTAHSSAAPSHLRFLARDMIKDGPQTGLSAA